MKLKFNNLNPCILLDTIIENGINATDIRITSNIKEDEEIAETVWVECLDTDSETIKSLAENLDNIKVIKEPIKQEQINAQLLEEITQQKIVNAQLMQEIATLKGGITNV